MVSTSYSEAREHFADYWNRAVEDREVVRVSRRGSSDIAIIAADDLDSLLETVYLFRSPRNAARLSAALDRALAHSEQPTSVSDLRQELGIAQKSRRA